MDIIELPMPQNCKYYPEITVVRVWSSSRSRRLQGRKHPTVKEPLNSAAVERNAEATDDDQTETARSICVLQISNV